MGGWTVLVGQVIGLVSLVGLVGCEEALSPASSVAVPGSEAAPVERATRITGRWTSETVCVAFFANGEFELITQPMGRKTLVMGRAEHLGGDEYRLSTHRIWRPRYSSPCRRSHHLGEFVESHAALGGNFAPDTTLSTRISLGPAGALRFCIEECVDLTRDDPVFGAIWRTEGLDVPDRPSRPLVPGEILRLDVRERGSLWIATGPESFATVNALMSFESVEPDFFRLSIEPGRVDARSGTEPSIVLGRTFDANRAFELRVERLTGQRLNVCAGSECTILNRRFQSSSYDLY